MDFWIKELEKLMKTNNMVVHLLTKYVDDVVVVCDKLELGSRFKGGRIVIEAPKKDLNCTGVERK